MNTSPAASLVQPAQDDVPASEAIRRSLASLSIGALETDPVEPVDTASLCRQIGIWPAPADYPQQLRALLCVAPPLLQLYESAIVGGSRPMFERWKAAVGRDDAAAAAYWLMQLKLWPQARPELAAPLAPNGVQLRPIRPANPKALSVVAKAPRVTANTSD